MNFSRRLHFTKDLRLRQTGEALKFEPMKAALRQNAKRLRESLSEEKRKEKEAHIYETLNLLPEFRSAERILFYVSNKDELDTRQFIKNRLDTGKLVLVPKIHEGSLKANVIMTWSDLAPGQMGILEPTEAHEVPAESIDLVIVPGLAFDRNGMRIGYGAGHYDRFLKTCPAVRVALAYHEQLHDEIPTEDHDQAMNIIITDKELIRL
jgi:5-formyltetrahydrofolate cyclo-ligase